MGANAKVLNMLMSECFFCIVSAISNVQVIYKITHLLKIFLLGFFTSGVFRLICRTRSKKISVTFIFVFADVSRKVLELVEI